MFKGFEQHDSGEFTNWLLDAIHEDMYRGTTKPGTSKPEEKGPDIEIAELFWNCHL